MSALMRRTRGPSWLALGLCLLSLAADAEPEAEFDPSYPLAQPAERLAALWDAADSGGMIHECGADGAQNVSASFMAAEARALGRLDTEAQAQYDAWKRAHRMKYAIELARGHTDCGAPERRPVLDPSVEPGLLQATDALI